MNEVYKKMDFYEENDNSAPVDNSGFYGDFYRKKQKLTSITEEEFIQTIGNNNKLNKILRNIREIDRDNNGYVTN